jgi:flagellar motor switch protein FliM
VREIDFSRPTKFTTDQMRRIERAHESFCRAASAQLATDLRAEIELEVINISQLTLAGALADVPSATLYGIPRLDDIGTPILFGIEMTAVTTMIERLLGGGGMPPMAMPADREMTDIERALARRVLSRIVDELSNVWEELFHVRLTLDRIETQLMNVQLATPSEPTVAITIEFRLGQMSATASLVVPYRSIEDVVGRLPSAQADGVIEQSGDGQAAAAVRATLSAVEVELRVEVGAVEVPLTRILGLKAGDVLSLGSPSSSGVTVYADGTATHRARPGRRGRRRAIEILERLEGGR